MSKQAPSGAATALDYAYLVLAAFTAMAARSLRQQVDVEAALRAAGLPTSGPYVDAALRFLLEDGAISDVVPLSDGGILLIVTGVVPGTPPMSQLRIEDLEMPPRLRGQRRQSIFDRPIRQGRHFGVARLGDRRR
jgi:hypothetical protein